MTGARTDDTPPITDTRLQKYGDDVPAPAWLLGGTPLGSVLLRDTCTHTDRLHD